MQAPEDNSITVVEPHVETYTDNLNEKNLGTQYIYTTEGQLIPASGDLNNSNMELNSQHYNTVHVTDPQDIHIQQVDYHYEQQYPEGTVQQVVPNTGTQLVQDQSFVIEEATFEPQTSQEVSATEQQEYGSETLTEQQPTTLEYSENTEVEETFITEQSVVSEGRATDAATDVSVRQVPSEKIKAGQVEQPSETSENVEATDNFEPAVVEPAADQSTENTSQSNNVQENLQTAVDLKTATSLEEDQRHIENLKSNPAIEIEDDEGVDDPEEAAQETETVDVAKTRKLRKTIVKVVVEATPKEKAGLEEADVQEVESLEDDPAGNVEDVSVTEGASSKSNAKPRPRGRKPKTDIPLHILGHDVSKPMENFVNGKTPKPRLGVKVPYRNLTSQIVSKAEIEKEIIERGRKKQEEQKEISFARQLTSRLAQKIAPGSDENSKAKSSKSSKKKDKEDAAATGMNKPAEVDDNANEDSTKEKPKDSIDNNSDLLAILEGEGDSEEIVELETEVQNKESTPTDETNIKNLEREIALQQLHDLPYLSPKTRFVKGNKFKVYSKDLPPPEGKPASLSDKTAPPTKSHALRSPGKSSNTVKVDVEPQIKVNMTLKTYSRKRKSSDGVVEFVPPPSKKTNVVVSTHEIDIKPNVKSPSKTDPAYVTKSSRIIKKKVIWDPDGSSSKSKASPMKVEAVVSPPKVIQKPVQSKNENKTADLPKKSAVDIKVKTDKKVEEKPASKKIVNTEKRPSPSALKLAVKPKKSKTEVDRLLGDEGAIKMLYDLKKSENSEKRKKTVFSVEKTFKDLAKKANQIKSDLVNTSTTETPKFLRKKEPAMSPGTAPASKPSSVTASTPVVAPGAISRQKSKDSARSTPPASPTFSFPNEVSYLIRRRSSSSISSGDDTGGSLEFDDSEERLPKKKPVSTSDESLKIRKSKKSKPDSDKSQKRAENRIGQYKTFSFKKANKSVTIDLHTDTTTDGYFTSELLDELTTALNKISKEKDCNVVLIKSSMESVFSHGINYKSLVSDKEIARKNKANELAHRIKNFIICLLDFPKILVAGIRGKCAGLAVTMLPLFDIVIASDDAQFSTTYSSLGCVAEAGFLLTVPHMTSFGLAGELLYAAQTLTADEACRRGLVSKLCWPEKYLDTIKATVVAVAQGSRQSLEATKNQLRYNVRETSDEAIDAMVTELVQHWTSNECQTKFAQIE